MAIRLIGNSHSVCLLDATTNWRAEVNFVNKSRAHYESKDFAGYSKLELDSPGIPVTASSEFQEFMPLTICLDTGVLGRNQILNRYKSKSGVAMSKPGDLLQKFINLLDKEDIVLSLLFGSDHSGESLIARPQHQPLYDFESHFCDLKVEGNPQPLDSLHIKNTIKNWTLSVRRSLKWINDATPKKVIHCLPPPPVKNPQAIGETEIFSRAIKNYGFLDSTLRLKWYLEYAEAVKIHLSQRHIHCIRPPQEALDDSGFLLPEYAEGITHGNKGYGALLAKKLYKILI